MQQIIQVTRNYENKAEEGRVRAGQRFAVRISVDGLPVVSEGRARQLLEGNMAREWKPNGELAPLPLTPPPTYGGQSRGESVTLGTKKNQQRTAAKEREAAPAAPLPLVSPAGGRTGGKASASSSEAGRASTNAPLSKRGNRRSKSSPSTTPTKSSHGQPSSTAATADGGDSTMAAPASKA